MNTKKKQFFRIMTPLPPSSIICMMLPTVFCQLDPKPTPHPNLAPLRSGWWKQFGHHQKSGWASKSQNSRCRCVCDSIPVEVDWKTVDGSEIPNVERKAAWRKRLKCFIWRSSKCWFPQQKTRYPSPRELNFKSLEVLGKAEIRQLNMTSPWELNKRPQKKGIVLAQQFVSADC